MVYDFEVLLDDTLRQLDVAPAANASDYDHRANLTGASGFMERMVRHETVAVPMTAVELAHVLLSDSHQLDLLAERFGEKDPFAPLVDELRSVASATAIQAALFYSTYTVT